MRATLWLRPQLQVELSFATGQIINVYGEMDDDGFYMGEIDGVRGLVPSNFLTEAPDQYGPGGASAQQMGRGPAGQQQRGGRGHGPGARGPPPPPRDGTGRGPRKQFFGFVLVFWFSNGSCLRFFGITLLIII